MWQHRYKAEQKEMCFHSIYLKTKYFDHYSFRINLGSLKTSGKNTWFDEVEGRQYKEYDIFYNVNKKAMERAKDKRDRQWDLNQNFPFISYFITTNIVLASAKYLFIIYWFH